MYLEPFLLRRVGPISLAFGLVLPGTLWASTLTWTGLGVSDGWSVAENWSPVNTPATGDTLVFPAGSSLNNNDLVNLELHSIQFTGVGGSFLHGNPVLIDSDITAANSSGESRIYFDVTFPTGGTIYTTSGGVLNLEDNVFVNSSQLILYTLVTNSTGTNLMIQGSIQGNADLVKLGAGDVYLFGTLANLYTGGTYVRGGTLHLDKQGVPAVSPRISVGNTVAAFTMLKDETTGNYPSPLDVTVGGFGRWLLNDTATVTNLVMIPTEALGYDPNGGAIAGNGFLALGCDVVVTNENGGGNGGALNCTVLLGSQTRTFHVADNFNDTFPPGVQNYFRTYGSVVGTGGAGIIKDGFGALALGGVNGYDGLTLISQGTLAVANNNALGSTSAGTIVNDGATLELDGVILAEPITISSNGFVTSINFEFLSELDGPLVLDGFCRLSGDGGLNINGVISGPNGMDLEGGQVQLGGNAANTFTGTVYVAFEGSPTTLVLSKAGGLNAIPGLVYVSDVDSTFAAVLTNAQDNGVADVYLGNQASWLLGGHTVAPRSLWFAGGATVDTQGGQLQLANAPGTNRLYLAVDTSLFNPFTNFTAQIIGRLACLAPTNDFVIDSNLTLSVSAQITGSGTLRKEGAGTLDLSGNNAFTGPLVVDSGWLIDDSSTALNATSSGTIVNNGATLLINSPALYCGSPLTLQGTGVNGTNGALTFAVGPLVTNGVTLNGGATIYTPSGTSPGISCTINGTGPLTKTGSGSLTLLGNNANIFSGDTIAANGTLGLAKPDGVPAVPGNLTIGTRSGLALGGTAATVLQLQSGGVGGTNVTVNGGSLYDLDSHNQSLVSVNLNNGGSIHTESGTLTFSGAIGTGTRVSVNPGHNSSAVISGNVIVDFGGTFTVGADLFPSQSPSPELDMQAVVGDVFSSSLGKNGAGEMRLSAANTFSSTFFVSEGQLTVANPLALGTTTGGTVVNGTGTLAINGGSGMVINNEALTLSSSGTPALASFSGSNTWTAPITLSATAVIDVDPTNGYLQVLNSVSGMGGLTKTGLGTLQFWGFTANTYTGPTTVAQGVLEGGRVSLVSVPGDVVIGDDSTSTTLATLRCLREQQIAPTANVTVHSSGYLYLFDYPGVPPPNQQLRTLTGTGQVRIDSQALLTISNDVPFTYNGALAGGNLSGIPAVVKRGPGTMALGAKSSGSSFFGIANDTAGTVQVDGSFGNMTVDVKTGAVLTGDGNVNSVVVENGGTIGVDSAAPGRNGGQFQVLSLQATNGSTVQLDFFGPSPIGGNDEIFATSTTVVSNATLSATFHYAPRDGDVLPLVQSSLSTPKGAFAGWPEGTTQTISGIPCRITYTYAAPGGSAIALTVTNLALTYFSYTLAEGNGNQTVEPDECNLLYVSLLNRRASPVMITNAVLRATSSNTVVTIASASYPAVPAGGVAANTTPFQFRTDPAMPCGSPVSFELTLGVANEGTFAVDFSPVSGLVCTNPTGPCESCTVVSGKFTTNTPTTLQPLYFVGAPSLCLPTKACPGVDPGTNLPPFAYITHSFVNNTTNSLCLTAQLDYNCPAAPTNVLGVAAYLGAFDTNQPCSGYLGDIGVGGPPYPPFSFQVPAGSNFVLVVMARATNLVCNSYSLELFGLPCPPPTLAISPESIAGKVRVHWSTAYPGWVAQQEGTLAQTFSNVAQPAVIVDGRYALTNITALTNEFYRLHKP